jgi:Peptidase M50B-like
MGGVRQDIPVVGEPVAFGIGLVALVLVALTGGLGASLVTVAHEGGHMATALLFGRGVTSFELTDEPGRMEGGTGVTGIRGFGVSDLFIGFAGYAAPPLLGLGGAYVIADGNAWGVLWIGIVLLAAMLLTNANALAAVITGLALAGVFWAAVAGGPAVPAAVAVGLVWLLLIGGLRDTITYGTGASDAAFLADNTGIPRVVWAVLWLALAAVALWVGGRLLLGL